LKQATDKGIKEDDLPSKKKKLKRDS